MKNSFIYSDYFKVIMEQVPKFMLILAIILVILSFLWQMGFKLGSLPGDIKIDNKNMKIAIPLTSSLIISILLSLAYYLFIKQ